MGQNVNENKAMTKVVIANINGAECERKQGNDEGSSLQWEWIQKVSLSDITMITR